MTIRFDLEDITTTISHELTYFATATLPAAIDTLPMRLLCCRCYGERAAARYDNIRLRAAVCYASALHAAPPFSPYAIDFAAAEGCRLRLFRRRRRC